MPESRTPAYSGMSLLQNKKAAIEIIPGVGLSPKSRRGIGSRALPICQDEDYLEKVTVLTGIKYTFHVQIPTPTGKWMPTFVVWMIHEGTDYPYRYTAYPDVETDSEYLTLGRRRR